MGAMESVPKHRHKHTGASDTLNLALGHRELKLGGVYVVQIFNTGAGSSNGLFTFNGANTAMPKQTSS
jgi:hypothetical protein